MIKAITPLIFRRKMTRIIFVNLELERESPGHQRQSWAAGDEQSRSGRTVFGGRSSGQAPNYRVRGNGKRTRSRQGEPASAAVLAGAVAAGDGLGRLRPLWRV